MKIPLFLAEANLLDLQNTPDKGFFGDENGWIVLFAYLTACIFTFRYARRNGLNKLLAVACCAFIPFGVILIVLAPWWLIISCFIGVPVLSRVRVRTPLPPAPSRTPRDPGLN